jgi:hypothetical protein
MLPRPVAALAFMLACPLVSQCAFDPVPMEVEPTLSESLLSLDKMRNGRATAFEEVEKIGAKLLDKYKVPAERAKIYFQLAHVYAQSGIDMHPDCVTKYGQLALEIERDPIQRSLLHIYLGCAAEVEAGDKTFSEKRLKATKAYLVGYKETLTLKLPDDAPELPGVDIIEERGDPETAKANRLRHDAQMNARKAAEFLRAMVHNRDILRRQVLELYRREPAADKELSEIAEQVLGNRKDAEKLLDGFKPKQVEK